MPKKKTPNKSATKIAKRQKVFSKASKAARKSAEKEFTPKHTPKIAARAGRGLEATGPHIRARQAITGKKKFTGNKAAEKMADTASKSAHSAVRRKGKNVLRKKKK